jgi:phosphinothricin acetyltransferase
MLRAVKIEDAGAIAAIYNYYVKETAVSFEEAEVSENEMARRIKEFTGEGYPWFVVEGSGLEALPAPLSGYAYLHKFHERSAYRLTAEPSVYLKRGFERRGTGTELMQALIKAGRAMGLHALVSLVTLPNPGSQALHKKLGFEQAAHLREVGLKFGKRLDVAYYELLL